MFRFLGQEAWTGRQPQKNLAASAPPKWAPPSGFTLMELLVVIAIIAILLAVAIPGYRQLILNNNMISELYTLRGILSHARTEATSTRASVIVCPTSNGTSCASGSNWSQGYMTFVDVDGDGVQDPSNLREQIVQWKSRLSSVDITLSSASDVIRFSPQGTVLGTEGTFTFCDERGARKARALILNAVGSVNAAVDSDDPTDGLVNGAGGTNVNC